MRTRRMFLLVMLALSGGCTMPTVSDFPGQPEEPKEIVSDAQSVNSGLRQDESKLSELISLAEGGDRDAAFRLSLHYRFSGSLSEAERWQVASATLGHPIAQYNLWHKLKGNTDCKEKLSALSWLEKAASSNYQPALLKLEEFRKEIAACAN